MKNHMDVRWKVVGRNGSFYIKSEGPFATASDRYIAERVSDLPDDESGEKALQHICDLHNASLEKEAPKPAVAPKPVLRCEYCKGDANRLSRPAVLSYCDGSGLYTDYSYRLCDSCRKLLRGQFKYVKGAK